ncbi:DUF5677 domain-containing protein [Paraburkholderia strydomiana]|uniref:DUF5677 domain-containing protein n=1 Tax=Paraburkholderia strydomiana TaxID=1245417 RepID=UPI001BE8EBDD|nr:DUF5677 domain-containing protein [Paraburkholderia strydomiana]MBT2794780.1 hypothetical protein [Paraburkholderia strydomiana]
MNAEELLKISGHILEDLQGLIRGATPPQAGAKNLQLRLVLTIAEQFEATLKLSNAHISTHAATHVRSMIEALVTMKMLEQEQDAYIEQMRYEQLRGEKRVYEAILADSELPEDVKRPIRVRLSTCKPSYDTLHAAGLRPKRIADDFGKTGLSHLVGPYAMLCNFTHNDLSTLAFRHGDKGGMIYRAEDSPQLLTSIFSSALQVVMAATHRFGELAKFADGHFESIFEQMNIKWRRILDDRVEPKAT